MGSDDLSFKEKPWRNNFGILHSCIPKQECKSCSPERSRIAGEVKDNENILVLFCGVGPFLIPIAKKKKVNIIGLEKNPFACALFRKNTGLNKIDADIILGDADLMNDLFKTHGVIHFYTFKKDFEIVHFKKLLEEKGWQIDYYRKCGNVAPRVGRYVYDMRIHEA